jgi:hypothetical protein
MSIVTEQVATNVLDGMININETRRNIDASIDESRCIILDSEDISKSLSQFPYNVGQVSDGKVIRLDEKEIYYKVTSNISMIKEEKEAESFLYRSSDRGEKEKSHITAYVNGLKIPDNEVLFYPTKSNVDIFIPLKYINKNGSEILIERKLHNIYSYIRFYEKNTSGQEFRITVDPTILSRAIAKERTVMVFTNKKLYNGPRSIFIENNDTIVVSLFQEITNCELEIIIDSAISFYLIQNPMEFGKTGVFEIPETYIDSIHGPISKFSCYFFADGKRLLNDKITQQGRLHFSYDFDNNTNAVLSMYVTDIGFINDKSSIFYGSDYYLYNMIGTSPISPVLKGGVSNTIFDGNIDFDLTLSNDNGSLYDRQGINDILKTYRELGSAEDRIKYILPDRPYLMRTFLENYGKELYTYTVDFNGNDPFVYIGIPNTFELAEKRNYEISVNTYHIPSNDIEVINKDITDIFKLPSKLFRTGKNVVEINVINEYEIEYVRFHKEDIKSHEGRYFVSIPVFERFISTNDVYVLERTQNPALVYALDKTSGYIHKKDVDIVYDDTTKIITAYLDSLPDDDIVIYSSNFTKLYKYQKPIASSAVDVMIPLYTGTNNDPVPYIPKGKLNVYAGNNKLIQGIDYFIKHPVNEDSAGGSFIIIKRAVMPGTTFDIYFSSIQVKQLITYAGYIKNNPYGLFYLGNLEFPVSLKYLDIYINNKKLTEADVDILSDKLIRIHSLPVPMYDLCVESTFTLEDEYLRPFIDLYQEDEFEIFIASLFRGVWYNRPYIPNEENPDYNTIYEDFIDSVDSVFQEPNPKARESEWIPSYNEDPSKIGVHNDGDAMGGKDIFTSLIIGNIYIVAGEDGRIAACNLESLKWSNWDSGEKFTSDGSHFQGNITTSLFYKSYIIFATDMAEIAYYDIIRDVWGYPNIPIMNNDIKLNQPPSGFFEGAIRKILMVDSLFVAMGDNGNVSSYKFDNDHWYAYDSEYPHDCLTVKNIMGTIYDAFVITYLEKDILVVVGENGEVASGYVYSNSWTKPNGERHNIIKPGPIIFHNGNSRDFKDIYAVSAYLNYIIFYGKDGLVTFFDRETRTFYGYGDIRNITEDGHHNGYLDIKAAITYEAAMLIVGSNEGRVTSYFGENEHWNVYNGGKHISNDGDAMQYRNIYTIVYTFGSTNYIIFAGKDGKVCTFNIDVHELAFRYNPYKTAFLNWYTTPGNAYIVTDWVLPKEVIKLFTIYKEDNDPNYDVQVAGGDLDLVADIDMNDRGRYPKPYAERRQYIIDFIQSLEPGRYTQDEVWQRYMASKHKHILYPWDVLPLASGDEIEREEGTNITEPED